MSSERPAYRPLSPRHKRIFAAAAVAAIAYIGGMALARLELIRWWMGHCPGTSDACAWADVAFDWWPAALAVGVMMLAFLAHRLTVDRLHIP